MNSDITKWTLDDAKEFNRRAGNIGFPLLCIDEEQKMVYKDELHKLLGIGFKLNEH